MNALNANLRSSLARATRIAFEARAEYVDALHLGLALLDDPDASPLLVGLDRDVLEREVGRILARFVPCVGDESLPDEAVRMGGTVEVREILEAAVKSAERSGVPTDARHVLSHMVGTEDSFFAWALRRAGVDAGAVRRAGAPAPAGEGAPQPEDASAWLDDLTARAAAGELDPTVGRGDEIRRVVEVLARRRKSNAVLVGEPGVGKTAVVEGLASAIVSGRVPKRLKGARIYALDLAALVAGTKYRGDFEQRILKVVERMSSEPGAIVFIDEMHAIMGAGGSSGGMDAAGILKPALARGRLRCIGATTHAELKQIEKDKALMRRFERIDVTEPTVEETVAVLEGLRARYERHHGVRYDPSALRAAAELSDRHVRDRRLPDKAVDLLDEAGARVSLWGTGRTPTVGAADVESALAAVSRIPEKDLRGGARRRAKGLGEELALSVFGQGQAIAEVAKVVKIARAGLKRPDRPVGSFLFAGPTGVGKTELAKRTAEALGVPLLRFDMSEYMEEHAAARFIGSPPGYVGHAQGGQLTDAVDKAPNAVLLLDEIEKAHPKIMTLLLQVMDGGRLTDGTGKTVDFREVVLMMTTNLGARETAERKTYGFGAGRAPAQGEADEIVVAVEKGLAPEFRNRLDRTVVFSRLSRESMALVVDKALAELGGQLAEQGIAFDVTASARAWLCERGYDPDMGARPLGRLMDERLREPIADALLDVEPGELAFVRVDAEGDGLTVAVC